LVSVRAAPSITASHSLLSPQEQPKERGAKLRDTATNLVEFLTPQPILRSYLSRSSAGTTRPHSGAADKVRYWQQFAPPNRA
jgi:hypothetical protein